MKDVFENKMFDVEHGLSLYAKSFCTLPAEYIYDNEILKHYEDIIKLCHIYLIGYLPKTDLIKIVQEEKKLKFEFKIKNQTCYSYFQLPDNFNLIFDEEGYWVEDNDKKKHSISKEKIGESLAKHLHFNIQYIGQAFGSDGSRNAIDRLLKHETLQKIALTKRPEESKLSLLLLEIEPNNRIVTAFNPFAKKKDVNGTRIDAGLHKLFNTNKQEQISLFEACLIRYFSPKFNKEFKNSFPSTNLKILQDCYEKDFSAVMAEIFMEELPFQLYSDSVPPAVYHCAKFNLHQEKERKAFFFR